MESGAGHGFRNWYLHGIQERGGSGFSRGQGCVPLPAEKLLFRDRAPTEDNAGRRIAPAILIILETCPILARL
jgi:hypothetical protein